MPSLSELVRLHFERWETSRVEQSVFHSSAPEVVADHVERFAQTALGSRVRGALFYASSAGCVTGLELEDGRRIVVKAYQARWGSRFLSAVGRVQERLNEARFPCPCPIIGPGLAGPALATAEELLPDPGMRTFGASEMAPSARGLARQVSLCRGISEPDLGYHPLGTSTGGLYPKPHSPIFDFSLRTDEAKWIDQLATAAKAARAADDTPPTVVHTDWSARNVRLGDSEVVAAYDWDSLADATESVAVGQAAATWRSTGEASDPIAPGPDEVHAYLSAYEEASNQRFTVDQRQSGMGAALWVLAYTARLASTRLKLRQASESRGRGHVWRTMAGRICLDGLTYARGPVRRKARIQPHVQDL